MQPALPDLLLSSASRREIPHALIQSSVQAVAATVGSQAARDFRHLLPARIPHTPFFPWARSLEKRHGRRSVLFVVGITLAVAFVASAAVAWPRRDLSVGFTLATASDASTAAASPPCALAAASGHAA